MKNGIILCVAAASLGPLLFAEAKPQTADGLKFRAKLLALDTNEGCDVADFNGDGKPDVVAGRSWYAAPDFTPRPVRAIGELFDDYSHNCGEHAYDVDGDGLPDVVGLSFMSKTIYWYQNPGKAKLEQGKLWPEHPLIDAGVEANEACFMHDLDKDGVPEFIVDSWVAENPVCVYKFAKDAKGQPSLVKSTVSAKGNGHGMGFGDINGDGRVDILLGAGWYEQPAANAFAGEWKFHNDWDLPHASCPMLVTDLDGDGRNDMIWGNGHDYGLSWRRQLPPSADGKTAWEEHEIDKTFSQAHCLIFADLDGDGQVELVTGKRVRAHPQGDPGINDPAVVYYYKFDRASKQWTRYAISERNVGTGLQIRAADMNGDGRLDLVVAGKSGTYILFNEGK